MTSKAALPVSLTKNTLSYDQNVAASGDNVYVIWADTSGSKNDIFLMASANNGTSFSKISNLSNNQGNSTLPEIALTEDNAYVIWNDDANGNVIKKVKSDDNSTITSVGRTYDVFFKAAPNDGNTASFSKFKSLDISHTGGNSLFPQIATLEDNFFVVWKDDTTGHTDILLEIDVGLVQNEVQNKYEQYKQTLRDNIIEPLSALRVKLNEENTKKILSENVANKIAINNTLAKLDILLGKAHVLQTQLGNLTTLVKQRAANNTLTVQNEPLNSQPQTAGRSFAEISSLEVKDDILKEISDITANTMTINNDLEGELEKLNVTSMEYNKDLNALDDDLNKISERLDAVQTPLGSLPVGLKEAIPVFPILLTTSFLVCGYFLLRTGDLRKELRTKLGNNNPKDYIAKMVFPLWIDRLESHKKHALWFAVLLIPLFVFGASWIVLQQSVNVTKSFIGDNAASETLFNVAYLITLVLCVIVCCKIYSDTRKE